MINKKMIDGFCGSKSMATEMKKRRAQVITIDNQESFKPLICGDIRKLDNEVMKGIFFAHFSPPCTGFSVASIGSHWGGGHRAYIPKSDTSRLGLELLDKTIQLIAYGLQNNPAMKWTIENPRGVMRKVIDRIFKKYNLTDYKRTTAWYCKYGDTRGKPTDWWTNIEGLDLKGCKNYRYDKEGNVINQHCHHEQARRGAKTGTQGLKNNYERSKIPHALCKEILDHVHNSAQLEQLDQLGQCNTGN